MAIFIPIFLLSGHEERPKKSESDAFHELLLIVCTVVDHGYCNDITVVTNGHISIVVILFIQWNSWIATLFFLYRLISI